VTRFEVRIEEIDGSTDIVPVWAESAQEAIDRALNFIDYIERRPMYGQPASAVEIGSTLEDGDLSDTITSPELVAHRRIAADGNELGTIRRPVKARILEVTEIMRTSDSDGWRSLREAMRDVGLDPNDCVLVLEIIHEGVPVSGALIARDGGIFGFVRDRDGTLSVAGGEQQESLVRGFVALSAVAHEILTECRG
jgi:hypothetical protein